MQVKYIGGDATEAFRDVHRNSSRAKKIIKRLVIGPLSDAADKPAEAPPARPASARAARSTST